MCKSVYSLILTTFLATTSFAGDQPLDDLPLGPQQSKHSGVPFLSDTTTSIDTDTQESITPVLRRRGSGNDRGGCAARGRGLTRADFAAKKEESQQKPTHRRRPSGDKSGGGSGSGSGSGGDRGGFSAKLVVSHADFKARQNEKPSLKKVPSGHHGESAETPLENSNDFFEYAYQQRLLNKQTSVVEAY